MAVRAPTETASRAAEGAAHAALPAAAGPVRRVIVLGSTGSVGTQTLDVASSLNALHAAGAWPWGVQIVGLAAGSNAALLAEQARALGVRDVALASAGPEEGAGGPADPALMLPAGGRVRRGAGAAERLVREVPCDVVVAAIVGVRGLPATLAAVELGRDVALANKETLVAAGAIVTAAARRSGARLLPLDSEHSAAWQCLMSLAGPGLVCPCEPPAGLERLVLTASGGPFRERSTAECYDAPPEQALKHPTWSMGAKVTIDSATLVNKALELIEAHWLFGLPSRQLGVLIHPQSCVHALAEMVNGSVVAQMGSPDMRVPIQLALSAPGVAPARDVQRLDLAALGSLTFMKACEERWPALALARRVMDEGGTLGAVFNAANEVAVEAFLARRIPFGRIVELVSAAMEALPADEGGTLERVMAADAAARRFVAERIAGGAQGRVRGGAS